MGTMIDHRKRTRVSVHFEIAVLMENMTDPIPAEMINLSMTGVLCTSHPSFHKDLPCKVVLSLADDTRITIDSKILRVGTKETAISFVSMDEDSFIFLKKIVQYNSENPDIIDREFQTDAFDTLRD